MASSAGSKQGNVNSGPAITNVFALDKGLLLTSVPPAPEELNDEGTKWWNYYCSIFVQGQVLSRLFITSLTNLCILHMLRAELIDEITLQGGAVVEEYGMYKGEVVSKGKRYSSLAKDLQRVAIDMDRLLASMGMTAYTAKVNNIDTKGTLQKTKQGPPTEALFKEPSA